MLPKNQVIQNNYEDQPEMPPLLRQITVTTALYPRPRTLLLHILAQLPRKPRQRFPSITIPLRLRAARLPARHARRDALADSRQPEDVEGLRPRELAPTLHLLGGRCLAVQRHLEGRPSHGAGHVKVELGDLVDGRQAARGPGEETRVNADGLARVKAGGVEGREQVGEIGERVADCGHFPAGESVSSCSDNGDR